MITFETNELRGSPMIYLMPEITMEYSDKSRTDSSGKCVCLLSSEKIDKAELGDLQALELRGKGFFYSEIKLVFFTLG